MHPQVGISHGDFQAEVDAEIAPLILALWRIECWTVLSCQDNFGRVWISFANGGGAERFLTIVADRYDEDEGSLYQRIVSSYGESIAAVRAALKEHYPDLPEEDDAVFGRADDWWYSVGVNDLAIPDDDAPPADPPPADLTFAVSVRFPKSDYDEVLRRVEALGERGMTP
jgi:hypothetical protein